MKKNGWGDATRVCWFHLAARCQDLVPLVRENSTDRETQRMSMFPSNHPPSNLTRPPNASDQPCKDPNPPETTFLPWKIINHNNGFLRQEMEKKKMKVTYLHDVHDGERLLQQGVGVEDFGGGSLHATMRRNLQFGGWLIFSTSFSLSRERISETTPKQLEF